MSASQSRAAHSHFGRIVLGCAVMYLVLQGGMTLLAPRIDQTLAAVTVAAAMLVVAIGIERGFFGRNLPSGLRALGFSRPRSGAMVVSVILTVAMAAFFPVYSVVAGVPIALKADWLWVLLGAIALNGVAEETLFRGFVFGHLRHAGQSFWRAGITSLLVFALVHLYLFVANPPLVAGLATIVAISAAMPLAFLFERAGNTIWAGALLHVGTHFFRLVDIPEAEYMGVAVIWLVLQIGLPVLVLAFANSLLRVPTDVNQDALSHAAVADEGATT